MEWQAGRFSQRAQLSAAGQSHALISRWTGGRMDGVGVGRSMDEGTGLQRVERPFQASGAPALSGRSSEGETGLFQTSRAPAPHDGADHSRVKQGLFQTRNGAVAGGARQTRGVFESGSGGFGVQGDSRAWKASGALESEVTGRRGDPYRQKAPAGPERPPLQKNCNKSPFRLFIGVEA